MNEEEKLFVKGDTVKVVDSDLMFGGQEAVVDRVVDKFNVFVIMKGKGGGRYFRPSDLELVHDNLTDYSATMQDPRAKKVEQLDIAWSPDVLLAIASFGEGIQDLLQDFNNKEIFDMQSKGTEVTLKIEGPEDTFTVSFVAMSDGEVGVVFANVNEEKK